MTQNKFKRLHRIYSWCLAAVLILIGVLMILSCLDIYLSGPRAYSAEAIALRFQRIIVIVYLGLVGIIGGIALNIFCPLDSERPKSLTTPKEVMLRMQQKVSVPSVQKEANLRRTLKISTAALCTLLMLYPALYYVLPGHFTIEHLNNDVVTATMITLVPALIALALCGGCQLLLNASYRRETAYYKQALAAGQRAPKTTVQEEKCGKSQLWIRIILASIGVIFIVVGIINGGAEDVLKKAIAICTECIGLG